MRRKPELTGSGGWRRRGREGKLRPNGNAKMSPAGRLEFVRGGRCALAPPPPASGGRSRRLEMVGRKQIGPARGGQSIKRPAANAAPTCLTSRRRRPSRRLNNKTSPRPIKRRPCSFGSVHYKLCVRAAEQRGAKVKSADSFLLWPRRWPAGRHPDAH